MMAAEVMMVVVVSVIALHWQVVLLCPLQSCPHTASQSVRQCAAASQSQHASIRLPLPVNSGCA